MPCIDQALAVKKAPTSPALCSLGKKGTVIYTFHPQMSLHAREKWFG